MGSPVDVEDEYLFDEQLLKTLRWDDEREEKIAATLAENNLIVRPLKSGDYDRSFIALLSQLTQADTVSKQQFLERFRQMKECKTHYVVVIEDSITGHVIGSSTLLVEFKFIRSCALKGYLEDVVVSQDYRGKQLGKLLIETVTQLGQELGVYKVILNCKDHLIKFYEQLGFVREDENANMLQIRFHMKKNI